MNPSITWQKGDRALGYQVERVLNTGSEAGGELVVLRDNPRRRIVTLRAGERRVLVKHFRVGSGRHEFRDSWKTTLGRAPARREWRALRAMLSVGIPVPTPWVLGTLSDGDHMLVMEHLVGTPLDQALRRDALDPRARLAALGAIVAQIHAAGWIHGDLHTGNLLYKDGDWALLDWQHARRTRSSHARGADTARLEYSLARFFPLGQRMRLREAALSVSRPYDAAARSALRVAGDALWTRFDEHARSRTRRALRPGRLYQRVSFLGLAGLRTGDLSDHDLERVLAAHRAARRRPDDPRRLKDDARSCVTAVAFADRRLVVKEFPRRPLRKWLGDLVRGTPARRAWLAAHGLIARRIGVAHPFAYFEEQRLRPRSWVVLEDLRPATAAAFAIERGVTTPGRLADLLLALVLQLHRRGVDHGDLKGTHILLRRSGGSPPKAADGAGAMSSIEVCLIDLEGVSFRRRIGWRRRRRSLVQLNASLPDALPASLRRHFWQRYLQIFPIAGDPEAEAQRIVRRSLAREHRWMGRDCEGVRRSGRGRSSITASPR